MNSLASQQVDERELLLSRYESELATLHQSQYREFREVGWVRGEGHEGSVADPYHFDPDPGCEKIRYGSGSSVNFDTDPDPGKNDTDPDPARKYQENLQKV